jgi:hypothetical protein
MVDAINGLLGWRQNRPSGLSGPQSRDEAVAVEQFKVSRQSGMLTRAIERVLNASGLNQHCFNNVTKGPHDHGMVEHDAPPSRERVQRHV